MSTKEDHLAGVVLLITRKSPARGVELLLTLRDLITKESPLRFTLPAGGIDQNETAIDAALRECREEFGQFANFTQFIYLGRSPKGNHYFHAEVAFEIPTPYLAPGEGHLCAYFPLQAITDLFDNGTDAPGQLSGAISTFIGDNWAVFVRLFEDGTVPKEIFEMPKLLQFGPGR